MNWTKLRKWLLILAGLLVVLVASLIYVVLYNTKFHEYVKYRIIAKAEELTGGRVDLRDYKFSWRNLQADFYELTIHGTEKDPTTSFFYTEHLTVKLKILSVFKQKIDLREINFYRPKVQVWVDDQGHNNFPERRIKREAARTDLFDLAVKRFIVSEGVLYYNDAQIPMEFEVNNLQIGIGFDSPRTQYVGRLAYSNSQLKLPPRGILAHDLSTSFEIARTGARISQLTVTSGRTQFSATGTLTNYQQPVIAADYHAAVDMGELRGGLGQPQLPAGDVALNGSARFDSALPGPAMKKLTAQGHVASTQLHLSYPEFKTTVQHVRGNYLLTKGDLRLDDLAANALGGVVRGRAEAKDLATTPKFHVRAAINSIALQQVKRALGARLGSVQVTGTVNGQATAEWRGALEDLRAKGDLAIKASAAPTRAAGGGMVVPVQGAIHGSFDGARETLSLERSYLRTPHTELRLQGTVGNQARLDFSVRSDDLREIDLLAAGFTQAQKGQPAATALPVGLRGAAEFSGSVSGSIKNPHIAGTLTGRALQVHGTQWESVRADLELDESMVAIRRVQLFNAGGRIDLDLWAGLRNGSFTDYSPIRIQAALRQVEIADLERVAGLRYPVSGTLSATATITGSKARPVGNGAVRLTNARAWAEPIDSLSAQFQATGEEATVSNLRLTKSAGTLGGDLRYNFKTEAYELHLNAPQIDLARIETLKARGIPVSGSLSLNAAGRGTVKNPQLNATVRVPRLTVEREQLQNVTAQLNLANQLADFNVRSDVTGAFIHAQGQVALDRDYYLTARIDLRNAALETLLATYLPDKAPPVRGQFEATAAVKGPLQRIDALQAEAEIPKLDLHYQNMDLANIDPLRFHYRNGTLTIDRAAFKGTDTEVRLGGTIPLKNESQPMRVALDGAVNLKILQVVDRDLTSEGKAQLNLVATGSVAQPQIEGKLTIANGLLSSRDLPIIVSDINGEALFTGKRINISRLTAQAGGGQLQLSGFAVYDNQDVQFNVTANGQQIRVRYPEGVRILLDGNVSLQGTPQDARVTGQVLINRVSLTQNFDLANLLNQFSSPSVPPPPGAFTRHLRLDIGIRSTRELNFGQSKFNLQGLANLRIIGTASNPGLTGRINATDGELFFAGNRYRIIQGVIDFINPVRIEPVLNVAATTTVSRYDITIRLTGPFDKLRTSYTSDPPLPPVDVINLLAFGKTTERQQTGQSTATPPQFGATSILANALAGTVSSRAEKLFGITQLQIDPFLGGSGRSPSARLGIQQRVGKDFIFTFATGITSAQQELIQIEYQVSKRFSVTALRDENGSYAFDVKFRKVF